jgi:hypothetical protein
MLQWQQRRGGTLHGWTLQVSELPLVGQGGLVVEAGLGWGAFHCKWTLPVSCLWGYGEAGGGGQEGHGALII